MSELALGQIKGLSVNSNKVTVPTGHTLYAPGHVVQVVSNSYSTNFSTTSSSFADTPLSVSITPKFSTSKVLVTVSSIVYIDTVNNEIKGTIYRGNVSTGVNLGGGSSGLSAAKGAVSYATAPMTVHVLDSPGTTSATTYTFAISSANGNIVYSPVGGAKNVITVQEIAA